MSMQAIEFGTQTVAAEQLRTHLLGLAPVCRQPLPPEVREAVLLPRGLVDLRQIAPEIVVLAAPAWSEPDLRFLVRPEIALRLRQAAGSLPANLRLGFWEGLRPVSVQQTLWDASLAYLKSSYPEKGGHELEGMLEQFVARPTGKQPPHSTGSAVDVAPVDAFGRVLSPNDAWGRLAIESLAHALHETGLANCQPEWWHWSYGDAEWARVYDCAPLAFADTPEFAGPGDGI